MSALWVARHAPVAVSGVCYGQSDVPVEVDHGAGATRLAAQWAELSAVAYKKITRIWTSPWERTRGLAEALGKCLSVPVDADARLSEIAFGEWEGRSYAEIEANDGDRFRAWMADWERLAPPGGESVPALPSRASTPGGESSEQAPQSRSATPARFVRCARSREGSPMPRSRRRR